MVKHITPSKCRSHPRYGRFTFWLTLVLVCALFAQSAVSVEQQEKPQDITPPESTDTPKKEAAGTESASADAKPGGEEKGTLGDVTPEELAKAGEAAAKAKMEREQDAEERRAFREAKMKQEAEEEAAKEAELRKIPVTYGSVIVLRHDPTKKFVAATNFKYFHPHSSNQHQIIAADQEDGYTHWRVTPRAGQRWELVKDVPVKRGDVIRLSNMRTERALHSHQGPVSPYSGMNEVSNFGIDQGSKDANDNWVVHCEAEVWHYAAPLTLQHAPTKAILSSNPLGNTTNGNFTFGHQEVSASRTHKPPPKASDDADSQPPPPQDRHWSARPIGGAVGYGKYVALFEDLKAQEESRYAQLNSDPANGPKEISIYCPQNPVVSITDLDYNLVGEGKCLALNLQAPHFEASLTLNCDVNGKKH